ncbi:tetrahydrodipicolinate N-succinyltransferase N-terminal domain-containing protein [Helicobacter sp. 11S02629-2]|uniref:tetrahydrodipicolinate N-succinyltransferase N-terminal domain-containing protein n=1 Tax=Helicobacter sp. 11S02629-2 TaxID=1476195 RepID=UPI000BA597DD|nr:tetrahydrodipicolinate N-succinyltransferase N-terminal domain-containing protein [Helicobacter sp. 11S02629-2]PAF45986.1 2,3,4,5-tetrahydropyridine-2,6-carboxylate N-succinyltransferase [Helicobacter sp. 11S02629-2]
MDKFKQFVDEFYKGNKKPKFFGIARVSLGQISKKPLNVSFATFNWEENFGSFAVFASGLPKGTLDQNEIVHNIDRDFILHALAKFDPYLKEALNDRQSHKNIQSILKVQEILAANNFANPRDTSFQFIAFYEDLKPQSMQVAFAKLYALSLGKAKPRSLNLESIFGLFENVAWSKNTPYELAYLRENELALKLKGNYPAVDFVDKFPRYLMHIIPPFDNIRLLDSANTRLGASLASGYTQMPGASYVNFNAGTLGACMNEGRISSSVIVGEGSDIGGGASILGVLSGGNSEPISIGKNCLLGANSVTGISLGDGCIVDAGIAVLAGSVFSMDSKTAKEIKSMNASFVVKEDGFYKGKELSGLSGIHFRMDSKTGAMKALTNSKVFALNKSLH